MPTAEHPARPCIALQFRRRYWYLLWYNISEKEQTLTTKPPASNNEHTNINFDNDIDTAILWILCIHHSINVEKKNIPREVALLGGQCSDSPPCVDAEEDGGTVEARVISPHPSVWPRLSSAPVTTGHEEHLVTLGHVLSRDTCSLPHHDLSPPPAWLVTHFLSHRWDGLKTLSIFFLRPPFF